MNNTSAQGGYSNSPVTEGYPDGLTLKQFIQTVLVGISGLPGNLVRPRWQVEAPKAPDIGVDWIAFGIQATDHDVNVSLTTDAAGITTLKRNADLEVLCGFYGPNAFEMVTLVRDGFQIPQNTAALKANKMAYVDSTRALHIPDLQNERWVDKYEMTINLRYQTNRVYPVLSFTSANGTIHAASALHEYLIDWKTK